MNRVAGTGAILCRAVAFRARRDRNQDTKNARRRNMTLERWTKEEESHVASKEHNRSSAPRPPKRKEGRKGRATRCTDHYVYGLDQNGVCVRTIVDLAPQVAVRVRSHQVITEKRQLVNAFAAKVNVLFKIAEALQLTTLISNEEIS